MASIRAAEASEAATTGGTDSREGRSMIFGSSGQGEAGTGKSEARGLMPWSEEAKEKVRELGEQGEVGQCAALVRTRLARYVPGPECLSLTAYYLSLPVGNRHRNRDDRTLANATVVALAPLRLALLLLLQTFGRHWYVQCRLTSLQRGWFVSSLDRARQSSSTLARHRRPSSPASSTRPLFSFSTRLPSRSTRVSRLSRR